MAIYVGDYYAVMSGGVINAASGSVVVGDHYSAMSRGVISGVPASIESILPATVYEAGYDTVVISGIGFGAIQGSGYVLVDGVVPAAIVDWNDTSIVIVTAPHAAGVVDLTVCTDDGDSDTEVGGLEYLSATVVQPDPPTRTASSHALSAQWDVVTLAPGTDEWHIVSTFTAP